MKTPTLQCDAWRKEDLPTRCKLERRVVWALLSLLEEKGFTATQADDVDGEGENGVIRVNGKLDAMNRVFEVDERTVAFSKDGVRAGSIYFVLGNSPEEVVSDYSWRETVETGKEFAAIMDGFKAEEYI